MKITITPLLASRWIIITATVSKLSTSFLLNLWRSARVSQ
ncbi:hypothetical protein GBAR_LOCUS29629 [Geodia barretti]|uniref:Uncharacterized protein n=1 Tax=Geodia barretti TaxID=519541 RepID=A0AA35TU42_GEOBA|nr:hypothetical protein GBAR_LOCUS29629 [Geodia barretti]